VAHPGADADVRAVLRDPGALVGAFADAVPKGTVMFISNAIKIVGCLLMLFGAHRCFRTASSASAPPRTRRPSTAS
jgi:hypothetical protein